VSDIAQRTLEVRRDDWSDLRIASAPLPQALTTGQVLLAVDRFALTANNITYCQVGDLLGYWRFFPAEHGWGRVPAMGYATVSASGHPEIAVGERVWGFFPMGTHLLIEAGGVNPHGFRDTSAHREGLAPIYAQFQRAASNPIYEPEREEQDSLLRGLYLTAWLCEDALNESDNHGAVDCLISSASSKTAIALAHAVQARGRLRTVGLTSARNRDFCRALGCYDSVYCYDEVAELPRERPAVSVDMAGNRSVNEALHVHYGDQLRYACLIGSTHRQGAPENAPPLPGPQPELFFAPAQAGKRSAEWGAAVMEARIAENFAAFRRFADGWLKVRRFDGEAAAQTAFRQVLNGEAAPDEGYSVSLRES
jgi:hypothetical protein